MTRTIEVKGIGIPNKGAELMLIALKEKLKEIFPSYRLCCEPTTDFLERGKYELFQRTSFTYKNRLIEWSCLAAWLPKKVRERYGLVLESEVEIIFDVSGFAYGDQWGADKARTRLSGRIKRWKKAGKKVILMPQAFGPFECPALEKEMKVILEEADLVLARDEQSLAYLEEIVPGVAVRCPDFTNLVFPDAKPGHHSSYAEYAGRPCLIPNNKMLTMLSGNEAYIAEMASCLQRIIDSGGKPFILIHEGDDDRVLAENIIKALGVGVEVVDPKDAVEIKRVIGKSSFVISSRFHGLVSALSQGVPVVATGWSHKYYELMSDYDVVEFMASSNEGKSNVIELVNEMLLEGVAEKAAERIKKNVDVEKDKVIKMWELVENIVNERGNR